jgi:hypothetical protein
VSVVPLNATQMRAVIEQRAKKSRMNCETMNSANNIVIMRVENGYVVRRESLENGWNVPLRVASTARDLADMVHEWAMEQIGK